VNDRIRTPSNWGNRPVCRSVEDFLRWLEDQAERHRAVLRRDKCLVDSTGVNSRQDDPLVTIDPRLIRESQETLASDLCYAFDWLDVNVSVVPGSPVRPPWLESVASGDDPGLGSAEITGRLFSAHSALARPVAAASTPSCPVVYDRSDGKLRRDDRSIKLEAAEDCVIVALIELGGSATIDKLRDRSGIADAPRVLGRIVKKHSEFLGDTIKLPGGRGRGGYQTTIRFAK